MDADTDVPVPPTIEPSSQLFYRPESGTYSQRSRVISKQECDKIVQSWPISESLKLHGIFQGSILENRFPWQTKWHQRFDPPKSAEELEIGKYWRYDGPKLEQFIANDSQVKADAPLLEKSSLTVLKKMAVKILSGTTQESLVMNAFQKHTGTKGSLASDHDAITSVISAQLKMPENQTGEKRSILEGFTKTSRKQKGRRITS